MEEISVTCTRVVEGWHVVWLDSANVVWSEISASHPEPVKWTRALAAIKQVASVSEAERIVKQKGFEVNGQLVIDPSAKLDFTVPASYKIRLGKKKFLRLIVE
jgi:tyrosyl-tRNA synthetase